MVFNTLVLSIRDMCFLEFITDASQDKRTQYASVLLDEKASQISDDKVL